MMKARVFFAISFSKDIQLIFKDILMVLQQTIPEKTVRWIPFYNLHITLGFLGNIQVEHLPQLIENARLSLLNTRSFSLQIDRLQLFPDVKKPRIISLAVGPEVNLKEVADCMRQAIIATKYPAETRAFRGHLTLGRLRSFHLQDKILEQIEFPLIPEIWVSQIDLLESRPGKDTSCYTPLAHFNLK